MGTTGNIVKQREMGLLSVFQGFTSDQIEGATREQKTLEGEIKGNE